MGEQRRVTFSESAGCRAKGAKNQEHMIPRAVIILTLLGLWLASCASSETRSLVSAADIPSQRYGRVVLFVEHADPQERANLERAILLAFQGTRTAVQNGGELFKGRQVDEKAKARLVQRDFDAVFYVNVLQSGMAEELVPGARHDGQFISIYGETKPIDSYVEYFYKLKEDGSVYKDVPVLKTNADLQDTKSAKVVWTAETVATGGTLVLFGHAAKNIVDRLKADGVI